MTGPTWTIPMENVRLLAVANGLADILRLELRDARFQPHALQRLRGDRFVAICAYEEPKYPGRMQELVVMLAAVVKENAAGVLA